MFIPNPVTFLYVGLHEEQRFKKNVGTPEELPASILGAAAYIKWRENPLRRTTRDRRTPVAKCTEADGAFVERLLWSATDLLFKH